ncbi:hypothetical protein FPV67DRAFT_1760278 [Lyophyllum atratum]|nr:hypothetical protein FPV67DRAFT_1760278 [Lyophyllum atratum]
MLAARRGQRHSCLSTRSSLSSLCPSGTESQPLNELHTTGRPTPYPTLTRLYRRAGNGRGKTRAAAQEEGPGGTDAHVIALASGSDGGLGGIGRLQRLRAPPPDSSHPIAWLLGARSANSVSTTTHLAWLLRARSAIPPSSSSSQGGNAVSSAVMTHQGPLPPTPRIQDLAITPTSSLELSRRPRHFPHHSQTRSHGSSLRLVTGSVINHFELQGSPRQGRRRSSAATPPRLSARPHASDPSEETEDRAFFIRYYVSTARDARHSEVQFETSGKDVFPFGRDQLSVGARSQGGI